MFFLTSITTDSLISYLDMLVYDLPVVFYSKKTSHPFRAHFVTGVGLNLDHHWLVTH
jgi:hypothetical protein